jgi:hypothetical protein
MKANPSDLSHGQGLADARVFADLPVDDIGIRIIVPNDVPRLNFLLFCNMSNLAPFYACENFPLQRVTSFDPPGGSNRLKPIFLIIL